MEDEETVKWSENGEGDGREGARERCKQGDIGKQGRRAAFESSAKSAFQPSILPRAASWSPESFRKRLSQTLGRSRGKPWRARDPKPSLLAPRPHRHLLFLSSIFVLVDSLLFDELSDFQRKN